MDNQEEQNNIEVQPDLYLESPKAFHLEMPPYHNFDLSTKAISRKIYEILSNRATIDAYCIWCEKEGVFRAYNYISDNVSVPPWTKRNNGLIEIEYRCTRDESHAYHTYFFKTGDFFTKVGQFPSVADFQIPQVESYRKILDEEQYKEFTRGIGLSAHGVGIGSFVYLRRVFENLIEEAHVKAQAENKEFKNEDYIKARMDDKIQMVKDYLPDFLVENRSLYAILSKGIHDLSEDECLQYFETVKIGIEQILDEKIIKKEKVDKALKAREAIQKAHGKLANQ
ncbi:MAG: hypothetical protein UW80_C0022G0003 [Microgenomates group bacterium GW2011_GWC1_44_9]|nr:MAG: hypothetical protein UW80_C0022G0003 [Microgenomates group bacterium GW2011_GWC1_44_9]